MLGEATDKGRVPGAIRTTLTEKPEWFAVYNRGLTIVAKAIQFDSKSKQLTLKFHDRAYHGILDGGHTLKAILDTREAMQDEEQEGFCNLEIFTGLDESEIPSVVEARNSSKQVASKSLTNLQGKFDYLKGAISPEFESHISWMENDQGSMDVRELVALLTALDPEYGPAQPVVAYSGKETCLKRFRDKPEVYERLYGIASDALRMWDAIQFYLPEQYNKKGPEPGTGGKFGLLTGVKKTPKRPKELPFIGKSTEYQIPSGYVYPVLSAFRAMLVKEDNRWIWGKGFDPLKLIEEGVAADIFVASVRHSIKNYQNPNRTGKDTQAWMGAFQEARIKFLEYP